MILAFVMTLELIQIITDKNNFHDIETAVFFKWIFNTALRILIVTNTWNIVMGVFHVAQGIVAQASGVIGADASHRHFLRDGGFGAKAHGDGFGAAVRAVVPVPVYRPYHVGADHLYFYRHLWPYAGNISRHLGRAGPDGRYDGQGMGGMGQNYLRSLMALGFQAFLIMVCVAIYAVLVQNIATDEDTIAAIWSCVGYTVLLCLTLFKSGSMAKAIFQAH